MRLHLIAFFFTAVALALPPTTYSVDDALGTCAGCSVHYRDLPSIVQLCNKNKAVCSHAICKDCAENVHHSYGSTCPSCASYFSSTRDVALTPESVFDAMDIEKNGTLSLSQVKIAVMLLHPIRASALTMYLRMKWQTFDVDEENRISRSGFLELVRDLDTWRDGDARRYERPDLPFRRDVDVFFRMLDFNQDGKLNKREVKRALMYVMRAERDVGLKQHIDNVVDTHMKDNELMDLHQFSRFYYFRVGA